MKPMSFIKALGNISKTIVFLSIVSLAKCALADTEPTVFNATNITTEIVNGYKITRFHTKTGIGTRDVSPMPDGTVWFNGQFSGTVGHLDPKSGRIVLISLGPGSSPHGQIPGPDGNIWVVDGGMDAIVKIYPKTGKFEVYKLPHDPNGEGNINTPAFDRYGKLWFTGQNGIYGRFDPDTKKFDIFKAPNGFGPYGMATSPDGDIWYTNLAQNKIAHIDPKTLAIESMDLPESNAGGARRIWADSQGNIYVGTWFTGSIEKYNPKAKNWTVFKVPGLGPKLYSMYVDKYDNVWVSDFTSSSVWKFDPQNESFQEFKSPVPLAQLLEMNGVGESVWGGEQGVDNLIRFQKLPSQDSGKTIQDYLGQ